MKHRSHMPKSPVARAMLRAAWRVKTKRRSFLTTERRRRRVKRSKRDPWYAEEASKRLVAADDAFERGVSVREALGVKHRYARPRNLDAFCQQYVETALWATNDQSTPSGGQPLDANYSIDDISSQTLAEMVQDCKWFQHENEADLEHLNSSQAGYLFWLNRNGHGRGFWDEDGLDEDVRERLSEADAYGEYDLIVFNGRIVS